MAVTDAAILATAQEVAAARGLALDGGMLVDAAGDPWTLDEFAEEVAARLGYSAEAPPAPLSEPEAPPPPDPRVVRLLPKLARLRAAVGRKLLDKAEMAFAEAMRRVDIKVAGRSASRRTSKVVPARVAACLAGDEPRGALLAALGLTEEEALRGSFDEFQRQATEALAAFRRRQRALIEAAGLDPDEIAPESEAAIATGGVLLAAGLMRLARAQLTDGVQRNVRDPVVGEVTGHVPAQLAKQAMAVAEGRAHATLPRTPDQPPLVADLLDVLSPEQALAGDAAQYVWVHGFYGDSLSPLEPHEDLGASNFTTTSPLDDPALANGESFPLGDYFQPGDHEGCTCEWEVISGSWEDTGGDVIQPQLTVAD